MKREPMFNRVTGKWYTYQDHVKTVLSDPETKNLLQNTWLKALAKSDINFKK
tara:strand:+ start:1862 stop:2017 length:156 start_codon:yes stop_codon:yes gene_type:complete